MLADKKKSKKIIRQLLRFEHFVTFILLLLFCFIFHKMTTGIVFFVFLLRKANCKYLVANSARVEGNCELHTVSPQF